MTEPEGWVMDTTDVWVGRSGQPKAIVEVARVYRFDGHHSLPDVPGYEHDHKHAYRVEVVLDAPEFSNTDALDRAWAKLVVGPDVNHYCTPSTVEMLAAVIAEDLDAFPVNQVTVWEDDTRWGRWRR